MTNQTISVIKKVKAVEARQFDGNVDNLPADYQVTVIQACGIGGVWVAHTSPEGFPSRKHLNAGDWLVKEPLESQNGYKLIALTERELDEQYTRIKPETVDYFADGGLVAVAKSA